jgi:hypothetical protein
MDRWEVLENACMVKRGRGFSGEKKKVGDGNFRFSWGRVGYILGYIFGVPSTGRALVQLLPEST